ncbi:MAG: GNAT family N-acetyltransferase [Dehalococcoidia bacterium]
MGAAKIRVTSTPRRGVDGLACGAVLRSLPEWFGMESANAQYEADIPGLDTFTATDEAGDLLGFLAVKAHNEESQEIWVMAVRREWHRHGVGTRLMHTAEAWLASLGVRYVQVKTQGPSRDYEPYARTRAFYRAMAYVPIEEFTTLWDEENPALLLVKRIEA